MPQDVKPKSPLKALSPVAFVLHDLQSRFREMFPNFSIIQVPELEPVQLATNQYSLKMASMNNFFFGDEGKAKVKRIYPVFAWTRGPLMRLEGHEFRYTAASLHPVTVDGKKYTMDIRATQAEVSVFFKAFFNDVAQFENFESCYLNRVAINEVRVGEVKLPYINQPAKYTLVWGDFEELEWNVPAKNHMAVSFKLDIIGPTIVYAGDAIAINKIVFELRDYDDINIVYTHDEWDLRPRSEMPPR